MMDVLDSFWKPLFDLLFFLEVGRGRQADFGIIEIRIFQHPVPGEQRFTVVTAGETSMDMAGTDAEFQHHRRVALLRKFKTVFHHLHDLWQVRARVKQPDLGFHGKGMASFLNDAGTFSLFYTLLLCTIIYTLKSSKKLNTNTNLREFALC